MYALDTNILIYYAAGDPDILAFLRANENAVFYLPSIVIAEFLSYPLMTPAAAEKFHDFVRQTIVINLDYSIAVRAAAIRREVKLPLADALIAASSIAAHASLITRNVRDFKKVNGLNVLSL